MQIILALYGTSEDVLKQTKKEFIQFSREARIDLQMKIYLDFSCLIQDFSRYDIIVVPADDIYSILPDMASFIKNEKDRYHESNTIMHILPFPVSQKDFMEMVNKLSQQKIILDIPIAKGCKTELVNSIIYFENRNRRVHIKTISDSYQTDLTMREAQELTALYPFASPYVSFLANLEWVEQVMGRDVLLKNGEMIPLSQKRAARFKQIFRDHMSKKQ